MAGARANGARRLLGAALAAQLGLSACGGGGGGGSSTAGSDSSGTATNHYALSATIKGLNASGLVLSVNGSSIPVSSGATSQMLANALASGAAYSVSIASQPTGETCSLSESTGTIASANGSVVVTCSSQAFKLGGSVDGLTGNGLLIANGSATLTVGPGAKSFNFPAPVAVGSPYEVTVRTQPLGQTCTLSGNVGTMPASDVTSIALACTSTMYTIGGSITGLNAAGLVLLDHGADATVIGADATTFTMHTAVAYGASYAVTVQSQPTGRVCTVSDGAGTVGPANVTGITIACLNNMTLLYSFAGYPSSGVNPYAGLVQADNGDLYGTSEIGGASNLGAVFAVDPSAGTESLVHSFVGNLTDGTYPYAPLTKDKAGNLYGTTETGGSYVQCSPAQVCETNYGSVFKINPTTGVETLLYSFKGNAGSYNDGAYPYAGLILASDGYLFGTTEQGGSAGNGTVYRVNPKSGAGVALHSFAGGTGDGANPYAGLVQASDGNLYGTTKQGGAAGNGTVFRINPATGAESIVYAFLGGSDGASPYAGLVQAKDGNLYGTTGAGGASGAGTVFKVDPGTGAESVVYAFAGGTGDGANPYAGVIQASDGNLYGTTISGGANGDGTVFRIDPSTGAESLVYVFAGAVNDGAEPYGGLIQATDGYLYGTTLKGGSSDAGTVFRITIQ